MSDFDLFTFVKESNRIECIEVVRPRDVGAHQELLRLDRLDVNHLVEFVDRIAVAPLRSRSGMSVRVGSHYPPPGGPSIVIDLNQLLADAHYEKSDPFEMHVRYETLHPFMDGNGRSGRALWLWMMIKQKRQIYGSSFLHTFYYQALGAAR